MTSLGNGDDDTQDIPTLISINVLNPNEQFDYVIQPLDIGFVGFQWVQII